MLEKPILKTSEGVSIVDYSFEALFPESDRKIKITDSTNLNVAVPATGVIFDFEDNILHRNIVPLENVIEIQNFQGSVVALQGPFKNRRLNWKGKVLDLFEPCPLSDPLFIQNPYKMVFTEERVLDTVSFSKEGAAFTLPASSPITKYIVLDTRGRSLTLKDKINKGNVVFGQYNSWTESDLPELSLITESFLSGITPVYSDLAGSDIPANFEVIHNSRNYYSLENIRNAPSNFNPTKWKGAAHDDVILVPDRFGDSYRSALQIEGKIQTFVNSGEDYYTVNLNGRDYQIPGFDFLRVLWQNDTFHVLNSVRPSLKEGISKELFFTPESNISVTDDNEFKLNKLLHIKSRIWNGRVALSKSVIQENPFLIGNLLTRTGLYALQIDKGVFSSTSAFTYYNISSPSNLSFAYGFPDGEWITISYYSGGLPLVFRRSGSTTSESPFLERIFFIGEIS